MTKGKPTALIIKFMIPLVIGNIFQQLYNMVDTIIVGQQIGVNALAAVGATGTIMFLILGFMMGLTSGFTVLPAQRFGAGDIEGLKKSVANAIKLSAVITIVITVVSMVAMDRLLKIMNTPEDIFDLSKDYIMVICGGMCFGVLYNLTSGILRALGNSKVPLYSLIVSAFLNIALDLLFVVVIPLGVAGAALATVISQAVAGLICVIYIVKKLPIIALDKEHWKWDAISVRHQLGIGVPMALQFSITAVGTILVQSALNLLGSVAVAAYTAAVKVSQLAHQPYAAISMTVATFSAQNRGINDFTRIRRGAVITNVISTVYSVVVYGALLLTFPYILQLFVNEADYAQIFDYAQTYIVISGICFVPLGMIYIFRSVLQSCGYTLMPTMGGVVEMVCRGVVAFIAVKQSDFVMVCLADGGTWLVTGIFMTLSYLIIFKKNHPKERVTL
ncbi:MAG: MATE family efflux transporter [Lachnospiraceae bacterium]|nr:MATE family efflux transporter [Lachnospiraceae bacterium]